MKLYQVQALVIRTRVFNEADRLVTLFSSEKGKLKAVARGARRPRNRLSGSTGVFTYGKYSLFEGKSLENLSQAEVVVPFGDLRENLDKIAYASYFSELVDKTTEEGAPQKEIFTLLLESFYVIDTNINLALAARAFEIRLLTVLGLKPVLDRCARCQRSFDPHKKEPVKMSPAMGGIVCPHCQNPKEDKMITVSREALRQLSDLIWKKWTELVKIDPETKVNQDLDRMLQALLSFYIDDPIVSRTFLETVQMGSSHKKGADFHE